MLAGVLANLVFVGDLTVALDIGLGMYLVSFGLGRYALYRNAGRENVSKIYTTGLAIYVGTFILTWILTFTLTFG